MLAQLQHKLLEITVSVCQINLQAKEQRRDFFEYSTGAFIQLPVLLPASQNQDSKQLYSTIIHCFVAQI